MEVAFPGVAGMRAGRRDPSMMINWELREAGIESKGRVQ